MNLKGRLVKLEAMTADRSSQERCPRCQGTDLIEPGEAELLTVEEWPYQEALRLHEEICQRAARLAWCLACRRVVAVGAQDPDWRRQFWEGCEGPGLLRNMADLQFLRAVCSARTSWRASTEAR
jgi:hypothetical protein